MRDSVRIIFYGFFTWLIPFLVSIPFYSQAGVLLVDQQFFKSIMIIVGSLTGGVLIVTLFQKMSIGYLTAGYIVGVCWLMINWALDLLILIPMSNLDITSYFLQIGLRYLMIPVMSIMAGMVAYHAGNKGFHSD
jgi:hypothetical protein